MFSAAGNIVTDRRQALDPDNVNMLVTIQQNMKKAKILSAIKYKTLETQEEKEAHLQYEMQECEKETTPNKTSRCCIITFIIFVWQQKKLHC